MSSKPSHAELQAAIAKLTPDEAAHFIAKLEVSAQKNRIQLWGYLVAIAMWLLTMAGALVYYTYSPKGTFVAWVLTIPFVTVGVLLWLFGRWADAVAARGLAQLEMRAAAIALAAATAPRSSTPSRVTKTPNRSVN